MDTMLVATIVGSLAAVAAAIVGLVSYRRSKAHQSPAVRIDDVALGLEQNPSTDPVPVCVQLTVTNTGDGLAKDLDVAAWVFMVKENQFTVPSDEELGQPHYTAHLASVRSGESMNMTAFRSGSAHAEKLIPAFDADAVPLVKVTAKFSDRFCKPFVEKSVTAAAPAGYAVSGYDHSPE